MAYDDVLAERIRELLLDEAGVTETKIFGAHHAVMKGCSIPPKERKPNRQ